VTKTRAIYILFLILSTRKSSPWGTPNKQNIILTGKKHQFRHTLADNKNKTKTKNRE